MDQMKPRRLLLFGTLMALAIGSTFFFGGGERIQSSAPLPSEPRSVSYTDTVAAVTGLGETAGDGPPDGITLYTVSQNGQGMGVSYVPDFFPADRDAFREAREAELTASICGDPTLHAASENMRVEYEWFDPDDERVAVIFAGRRFC